MPLRSVQGKRSTHPNTGIWVCLAVQFFLGSFLQAQETTASAQAVAESGPSARVVTIPDGTPVEMRFAQAVRGKMLDPVERWNRSESRWCAPAEPHDLVFQSVVKGTSMNDQNIVRHHLRPAALKLKLNPKKVTWRALRTPYGTWMVQSGANPKDVQAQMRHSRISTTMDIYAQFVPESQQAAVAPVVEKVEKASGESNRYVLVRNPQSDSPQVIENIVELVGIEPTTSSLRTMGSPIFPRLQSINYNQCWYITGIAITSARCSPTPKGH